MAEQQVTKREFDALKRELQTLRFLMTRKLGLGSADIKGDVVAPSTVTATVGANSVSKSSMVDDAVGKDELDYEEVTVTVTAGSASGTGTATSGSVIIGWRPNGNLDQFPDSISISGTTVTVTLAANATANNNFVVILIKD